MKYVVDEIIDSIVRLEDSETGEMKEVSIQELPFGVTEGNVLIWNSNDSCFYLAPDLEEKRRQRIADKLARVKRIKVKSERDENNEEN